MSYSQSLISFINPIRPFSGRMSRKAFWSWAPAYVVSVALFVAIFSRWLGHPYINFLQFIILIFVIAMLPLFVLFTRRIRDAGLPPGIMLTFPLYIIFVPPLIYFADVYEWIYPTSRGRLMPEGLYALFGYIALFPLTFLLCLLPSKTMTNTVSPNPNEVPQ
ncbi:DUF805 domain-containing protein [Aestuariibius insulae]|uniref:DUF805 domain-containing protein n=1 Tax=Aestuariibius insulae TaxID=2058287 RepID=UPI00345E3C01